MASRSQTFADAFPGAEFYPGVYRHLLPSSVELRSQALKYLTALVPTAAATSDEKLKSDKYLRDTLNLKRAEIFIADVAFDCAVSLATMHAIKQLQKYIRFEPGADRYRKVADSAINNLHTAPSELLSHISLTPAESNRFKEAVNARIATLFHRSDLEDDDSPYCVTDDLIDTFLTIPETIIDENLRNGEFPPTPREISDSMKQAGCSMEILTLAHLLSDSYEKYAKTKECLSNIRDHLEEDSPALDTIRKFQDYERLFIKENTRNGMSRAETAASLAAHFGCKISADDDDSLISTEH